nr:hypothetical protein [uncultured bacterium]
MVDRFRTMVCAHRIGTGAVSLFRVAMVRVRAMGEALGLKQSCNVSGPAAASLVRQVGPKAMAPFTCQHALRKSLLWSPAWLALATTAPYNKSAQRTAFGGRWPQR